MTRPATPSRTMREAYAILNADEREVLDLVAHRVARLGRASYGAIRLATDPRDWTLEALNECLDGIFYVAARLAGIRRELTARTGARLKRAGKEL